MNIRLTHFAAVFCLVCSMLALCVSTTVASTCAAGPKSIQIDPLKLAQFKASLKTTAAVKGMNDDDYARIMAMSPQEINDRLAAFAASIGVSDQRYDVTGTPCATNDLPFTQYLNTLTEGFDLNDRISANFMSIIVGYEALIFDNDETDEYFGVNGEHTTSVTHTERDLKRFWDIDSSKIYVVGMHTASALADHDLAGRTIRVALGLPDLGPGSGVVVGESWDNLYHSDNRWRLRRDDGAILSMNGISGRVTWNLEDGSTVTFGKIALGDGLLHAFDTIGYGNVAPQAILAHEYAHQVQFAKGYLATTITDPAEKGRRTELMADAFSAYYLTHARGLAMNKHRVADFNQVFFNIGDCGFTSSGHHGTPTQRRAAAQFGFNTANAARPQGHILTADRFYALFEAALPSIVAQ